MDIVLLCAGTSSRMGKTNKMLVNVNNTTMLENSTMQALKYLEDCDDGSTLILVTGYQRYKAERALKSCKDYVIHSNSKISMIVVYNKDFRKGQFTSVQTGVKQVKDNKPFFICLADMPKLTDKHYKQLENQLDNFDAVRIVCNETPGHPVLLCANMKKKILNAHSNNKVGSILKKCNVKTIHTQDTSWIEDIDTKEDLLCLSK